MTKLTVIGVILFFSSFLLHIAFVQFFGLRKFFFETVLFGVVCLFTYLLSTQFHIISCFVFFSLWLGYVLAIVGYFNSVTLHYLYEISKDPDRDYKKEEILGLYDEKSATQWRLKGLKDSQILNQKEEVIEITAKGRVVALFVRVFRQLFNIRKIG